MRRTIARILHRIADRITPTPAVVVKDFNPWTDEATTVDQVLHELRITGGVRVKQDVHLRGGYQ